jgi:hypothetical protein
MEAHESGVACDGNGAGRDRRELWPDIIAIASSVGYRNPNRSLNTSAAR